MYLANFLTTSFTIFRTTFIASTLITQTLTGVQVQAAGTPLLAPTLMSDIPEVEAAVRLRHADDVLVEIGEEKFHETKVFYADSNFFKVLTFPLAKGNPNTALKRSQHGRHHN